MKDVGVAGVARTVRNRCDGDGCSGVSAVQSRRRRAKAVSMTERCRFRAAYRCEGSERDGQP